MERNHQQLARNGEFSLKAGLPFSFETQEKGRGGILDLIRYFKKKNRGSEKKKEGKEGRKEGKQAAKLSQCVTL